MQHVHEIPRMRRTSHDFTSFTDSQLLSAFNAVNTREIRHFSDRPVLERRLIQLLDSRELMLDWFANGSQEMVTQDGVAIYSLRNHPSNRNALGHAADYQELIVHMLVDENPKTGRSMRRFDLYEEGISVADYVARCMAMIGGTRGRRAAHVDLRHDVSRGFISLECPYTQETIIKVEQFDRWWVGVLAMSRKKRDKERYERGEIPRPTFMEPEDISKTVS